MLAAVVAVVMSLELWTSGPFWKDFLTLNFIEYWEVTSDGCLLYLAGQTLPLVLPVSAGRRTQQVPDPAGESISRHDVWRNSGQEEKRREILRAAAELRAHTPPLECRTELLLSGHVGTNLHVTGFIFSSGASLRHYCADVSTLLWKHERLLDWRSWRL